ncbi:hypothetical protein [Pseudomonas syringae]|uniref:Uncharacterized protein n=1 Tax=Pseudomonas syringae TaxID=317 RepID=A0A085VNP0_PSESX|nr:hypothetical protein [Pseudomonas syringae]KFE57053.1 hypothetical protein IV01_05950 [Pseudomonas syringae]
MSDPDRLEKSVACRIPGIKKAVEDYSHRPPPIKVAHGEKGKYLASFHFPEITKVSISTFGYNLIIK